MIRNNTNRVQAIKSKFESLNHENEPLIVKKSAHQEHLSQQSSNNHQNEVEFGASSHNDNFAIDKDKMCIDSDSSAEDWSVAPNLSYLYSKSDIKRSANDFKSTLTRQSSDPGKKLHRSHAFRCDRNKIQPQRHGSYSGKSETSEFSIKMEKKLSDERLKKLSNLLEDQMRKENFVVPTKNTSLVRKDSIPNSEVPKHILDQYAMVIKPKREDSKQDAMTDSGVSSETENLEDDKTNRIKKLKSHFEHGSKESTSESKDSTPEKIVECLEYKPNLTSMNDLCASSETMRLERKNPHLVLTDTLKKALKQPLPAGPPPKKPPRSNQPEKKNTKHMLHKLEQVLEQREAEKVKNIYDIAETNLSLKKPKDVHYMCTEILDITHRPMQPNRNQNESISNCFNALNCAIIGNSTTSLPYTRLSQSLSSQRNSRFCSCSEENLPEAPFKEFLQEKKCAKCLDNDGKSFRCHVKCTCTPAKSEFFVEKEHIYDVPFAENTYGTLNLKLNRHKSLESLKMDEEKIYDTPCETSRPVTPTPEAKTEFQKLRESFERPLEKPTLKPKPILKPKSTENIFESTAQKRFKKYATERRSRRFEGSETFVKKNVQLDVDRQNLNRLMNEIYETVTAACNMDENRPGSFPTELSDGSTSEDSVKLTRSLTEKRKNYVRRVSSRVAYLDPKLKSRYRHQTSVCSYKSDVLENYSTFRSWKSFRTSQSNFFDMDRRDDVDGVSVDDKTGCGGVGESGGLFEACLLVGLNSMAGEAYVKSVFPAQVQVPPHIENLVFPETLSAACKGEYAPDARTAQCYSLVLTDERGERSYGYCRRVLPEGATVCLPLCYCIIGKYRAPGFYYKVLQEIESHHGSSEVEINSILQQLFQSDFPSPGEEITVSYCKKTNLHRNSLNLDLLKSKTMPDFRHNLKKFSKNELRTDSDNCENELPEFYDLENNNALKRVTVNFESPKTRSIKRPLEPRVDEHSISILLDNLGASLLIKVFGSLLLERKVIIISDQLSLLSSCLEALQIALYPFVWQQPLISAIPTEIQRDVLEAPLPMMAGLLKAGDLDTAGIIFEEGLLIDLTQQSKVVFYQGDESTILPSSNAKSLKTTLQMESIKQKDKQDVKTRNVMISEAFLRFFVDILGDFEKFLKIGEKKEGEMGKGSFVFDKEAFIKNAPSKQNQYFLEWFTETAMFNHFIQNMCSIHTNKKTDNYLPLVDTPSPNFYEIFDERMRSRCCINSDKNLEGKTNYKTAMNRKIKLLKSKLRELVN